MKRALALIGARLVWMAAILLVLSFALFGVLSALPGDPVDLLVTSNPNIRPDDVARLKKLRGLDKPWPVRWARWLVGHRLPLSPPPLSRTPPIVVDMPLEGPARVHLDVPVGSGADDVDPLVPRGAGGRDVVLEQPGVHELPRVVRDEHGLESVVVDEVLLSPPLDASGGTAPTPDDPDGRGPLGLDDDERQLGGSTEHKLGIGRAAETDRAAAARKIGRAVSLAAPRVYAAGDDGAAQVSAVDLVSARRDPSAELEGWDFRVVTGPGAFGADDVWRHRFAGPGQTAVVFRATAPTGASALGAFVVDHGVLEDNERFSRGALFVLLGDTEALGYSSTYKRPVWELLFGGADDRAVDPGVVEERPWSQRAASAIQRFGRVQNTVCLMLPALLLSLLVAVPLGAWAAARRGSVVDTIVQAISVAGVAMPAFWLGIMAMQLFAVALPWLPAGGIQTPGLTELGDVVIDRLHHAVLPVCVLALAWAGQWLRWVRSGLLEVLPSDFVRTARAKGLASRTVLVKHALRNALIPLVTVLALAAPQMFAGALLTETVFAWPGVGRLQYEAILHNDSYVAIVVFLVSATLVLLANLAADLLYLVIDPRLRRGGS